jgi:hypothetical protein
MSCLNDDEGDGQVTFCLPTTMTGFMGTYEFTDETGIRLVPDESFLQMDQTELAKFSPKVIVTGYMTQSMYESQAGKPLDEQVYTITVLSLSDMVAKDGQGTVMTTRGAAADTLLSKCQLPFIALDTLFMGTGSNYLRVNANYYVGSQTHSLPIFRYTDEPLKVATDASAPDTLDLYIGNWGLTDDFMQEESVSYAAMGIAPHIYYRAYDLSAVLMSIQGQLRERRVVLNINARQIRPYTSDTINVAYPVLYNYGY